MLEQSVGPSGPGLTWQPSLHESLMARSNSKPNRQGWKKAMWSLTCPFWPAQRSSLVMFQGFVESSFNCLKRWASFTRRDYSSLMVGLG